MISSYIRVLLLNVTVNMGHVASASVPRLESSVTLVRPGFITYIDGSIAGQSAPSLIILLGDGMVLMLVENLFNLETAYFSIE